MHPTSHDTTARFRANDWWEGVTLWDLFARNADREPERLALADAPNRVEFCVGEPVRWTYTQVRERADRLAAALVAEGPTCSGWRTRPTSGSSVARAISSSEEG